MNYTTHYTTINTIPHRHSNCMWCTGHHNFSLLSGKYLFCVFCICTAVMSGCVVYWKYCFWLVFAVFCLVFLVHLSLFQVYLFCICILYFHCCNVWLHCCQLQSKSCISSVFFSICSAVILNCTVSSFIESILSVLYLQCICLVFPVYLSCISSLFVLYLHCCNCGLHSW